MKKHKKAYRVWAIYYQVRYSRHDKWSEWVGPLGAYCLGEIISKELLDILGGRPFFTRTRKQARNVAEIKSRKANKTWKWVRYTVRPIHLTYEEI